MDLSKKIVLITSGQPSVNPRLVKEVNTLIKAGHDVTVIYQYRNAWATALDMNIIGKWKICRVGGDPINERAKYFFSKLIFKISTLISQHIGVFNFIAELALSRCTLQLISAARGIKADLYIAHNLGALPAAVIAAKKNQSKCGFDAEDFHRNEVSDDPNSFDVKIKTFIEDKYFKQLDYLSTSSPLISAEYAKLYPSLNPINILNTFPKQPIGERDRPKSKKLKLFWFSQTLGPARGIEEVILAMDGLPNVAIELHLLGDHDNDMKGYFNNLAKSKHLEAALYYYQPIPEAKIFSFAQQFDIGLATEIGIPKNRDICLTNKIFTYAQSGLAVIASNTRAQQLLLKEFANMGTNYDKEDITTLTAVLKTYVENPILLSTHQQNAKKYAETTLNWEFEHHKFLSNLQQVLS